MRPVRIKALLPIVIIGFVIAFTCHFIALAAIDAPHNESRTMDCDTFASTITMDGTLSANSTLATGIDPQNGGGGAGGSIWIESGTLTGTGTIAVNGADVVQQSGSYNAGGGGGGRIDVSGTIYSFSGSLTADGGNGYGDGDPGTIVP